MWKSTFSGEVFIIITIDIVVSMDSVVVHTSLACFGCVTWCYLITSSTDVERTVPFKVGRITAFETMILLLSIVTFIGRAMRVVWLSRCTRKGCRRNHNSNSLRFFDLLSKVRSRDCLNMTFNLMSNHHILFVDFVSFL
jgi:hypothetical protein